MLFRRAVFGNVAPCGILKHCSKCCADNTRFYVQTGTGRRGRRPLHISKSGAKVFYTTMYGVRCPSRRVTEHRSPVGFTTLYQKTKKTDAPPVRPPSLSYLLTKILNVSVDTLCHDLSSVFTVLNIIDHSVLVFKCLVYREEMTHLIKNVLRQL